MTHPINPSQPMFVEVGTRFINVASIAYVEINRGIHGQEVFIYLNASKTDGKLQRIEVGSKDEADQIGAFINAHLSVGANQS